MKPIVYFATLLIANATYVQVGGTKNTEPSDSKGIRKNIQSLDCSEVVNNGELTASVLASGVTTVIPYMASNSKASVTYNKNGGPDDVLNDIDITGYYHFLGNRSFDNVVNEPFGNIAENIIYNSPSLSEEGNAKIESYLAIKHGITLDQTAGQSYINSSGTEIYNVDGVYDDFDKGIIVIGQDDKGALDQRISKSMNAGSILTLVKDKDFTSANNSSVQTSLGDGNFLVTGHNGRAITFTEDFTNSDKANKRMMRTWAFDETGTVGNVHIAMETSDLTLPDNTDNKLYAILSTDQSFDGSDSAIEMTKDGDYWSAELNPEDGNLMTFAINEVSNELAPGGVSNNIIAWLKSESGTNTTTDGENVTTWNNSISNHPVYNLQHIPVISAINGSALDIPIYSSPPSYESNYENLINFHPTVYFKNERNIERLSVQEVNNSNSLLHSKNIKSSTVYCVENIERLFVQEVNNSNSLLHSKNIKSSTVYCVGSPHTEIRKSEDFWTGFERDYVHIPIMIDRGYVTFFEENPSPIPDRFIDTNITWHYKEVAIVKVEAQDLDKADVAYTKNSGSKYTLSDVNLSHGRYDVLGNCGNGNSFNEPFGHIVETIIYDSPKISDADNAKIESYLAIKYGITLDQSTPQSYINSEGIEIYDADGVFDNFDKNIFGIGQDDKGSLDQRISKSSNARFILILSNDADFTSANTDAGRTSLGNGNFLVTGHNGMATTFTVAFDGNDNARMPRVWAFDETGTVGNVHIAIKTSDVAVPDNDNLYAILSADQSFDGSDSVIEMTNDGTYWSAEVGPENGNYMTFAVNEVSDELAPGGVSNNIIAWLKSESGTNTTTDGENVTTWNNSISNHPVYNLQHIPVISAVNGSALDIPVRSAPPSYESSYENLINFHPTVYFKSGRNIERLFVQEVNNNSSSMHAKKIKSSTVYCIGSPHSKGRGSEDFWSGFEHNYVHIPIMIDRGHITFFEEDVSSPTPDRFLDANLSWYNDEAAIIKMKAQDLDNADVTYTKNSGSKHTLNGVNLSHGSYDVLGNWGNSNLFNEPFGRIVETIIYDSPEISDADNAKIESYLAIKYGITLDQSTPQSYINSEGIEIYDADGVFDNFDKNIFGIGQDDKGSLDQRISKSSNARSILILSNDADFTSTNTDVGRTSLGDGNFLVTGHNGMATTFTAAFDDNDNSRMPRIWAFDETGTVGNVHIAMKTSDVTLPDNTNDKLYAVLSTDQSFDGSDSVIEMTNDGSYWSTEMDPEDGNFMSFIIKEKQEESSIDIVALTTDYNLYYYKYNKGEIANGVWEKIPGTGIAATRKISDGVARFQDFDMISKNNIVATHLFNRGHNTYRWDGERWMALPVTDGGTGSISIAHDGTVFTVQDNKVHYLNGDKWTTLNISEPGWSSTGHIHDIDAFSRNEMYASDFYENLVRWNGSRMYVMAESLKEGGGSIHAYELSVGKDRSIFVCDYNPWRSDRKGIYEFDWSDELWIKKNTIMDDIINLEALTSDKLVAVDVSGKVYFWDGTDQRTPLSKIGSDGNSLKFIKASIGESTTPRSYRHSRTIDFETVSDLKNYTGEISMNKVVLYPNPANNKLHIRVNKAIRRASVEIYSMDGNLVYKKSNLSLSNGYSSISNLEQLLSSGSYVLKIRHKNGIISKIIIKK